MKDNGLKNNFDRDKIRKWFCFNEKCFYCDKYGWDAVHHIQKRNSNSLLNACPIHNEKCHLYNGKLHHKSVEKKLLKKTLLYLLKQNYKFDENDKRFIEMNLEIYKDISGGDNFLTN